MDVQRTITIIIADDSDLRATLAGFQGIQQRISQACYNDGTPLSALALHRAVYEDVKGSISSQMTCTAIRLVRILRQRQSQQEACTAPVHVPSTERAVPHWRARTRCSLRR